jgi:hypothetical protein
MEFGEKHGYQGKNNMTHTKAIFLKSTVTHNDGHSTLWIGDVQLVHLSSGQSESAP